MKTGTMKKIVTLLVLSIVLSEYSFITVMAGAGYEWNPSVDECNPEFNLFICKPTIDGTILPDAELVENDVNLIMNENDRSNTITVLSERNFLQRKAIVELYSKKNSNQESLYEKYSDNKEHAVYTQLLSVLLKTVSEQYVAYLITAASVEPEYKVYNLHGSTVFTLILGGISNKGLRHLDKAIKMSDTDTPGIAFSLALQMKKIGQYPENFIYMVTELLKGERVETSEINDKQYKEDLQNLKANLEIENEKRNNDHDKFLCDLLIKRSVPYLKKLFSEENNINFAKKLMSVTNDKFIAVAIIELYNMTVDRVEGLVWMLLRKKDSYFLFFLIMVSRSEIDLGNVNDRLITTDEETSNTVHIFYPLIQSVFKGLPLCRRPLLNILSPPDEIAWKNNKEKVEESVQNHVDQLNIAV